MWGSSTTIQSTDEGTVEKSSSDRVSSAEHARLIPVAAQGGQIVSLGDFEAGVDGWQADDHVTIDRVRGDNRPGIVSSDSTALRIESDGAVAPTVTNEQQARDVNWLDHPFLTATIRPGELRGTDAPVHAQLRLVHANGRTGRGNRVSSSSRAGARAHTGRARGAGPRHSSLTSETFRAPQGQPVRLYWDLRDVDERVRNSVVRLELRFERADQPASEGPYGRGPASGVHGSIDLEDVTLSDSPDVIAAAKLQTHWQQLVDAKGSHLKTVTEVKKNSVESGRFVFEDGEAHYDFEVKTDGAHVFTLGDRTYRFADGMAAVEP